MIDLKGRDLMTITSHMGGTAGGRLTPSVNVRIEGTNEATVSELLERIERAFELEAEDRAMLVADEEG